MDCCNNMYFASNDNHGTEESRLYENLKNELEKSLPLEQRCDSLVNFWLSNRGRHTKFIEYAVDKLAEEAIELNSNYVLGWCQFVRGWFSLDHDHNDQKEPSVALFLDAQQKFIASGERGAQIRAINGEASAYRQYGYFDKALERFIYALELAEDSKDDLLINIIASNIAALLIDFKQYEEAIKYFEKIDISKLNSQDEMAIQYSNLGMAYRGSGNYEKAEEMVLESLKLCQGGKNHFARVHSILELGFIRYNQARIDDARQLFQEILELTDDRNMSRVKAISFLQLGLIEQRTGHYEEALSFFQEALGIFRETDARSLEVQALLAMTEIYESLGDYASAYNILKEGKELESQVFSDETVSKMGIMKVKQARKENLIYKDLYNRINTISQIGQAITSSLDIKEIGGMVYDHLQTLMGVDQLVICLFDDEKSKISYKTCIRNGQYLPEYRSQSLSDGSFEYLCANTKGGILINEVANEDEILTEEGANALLKQGINSLVCSPLTIRGKVLGLISAQSCLENVYLEHHVDVLNALAAYTAIALENGNLFSYVKELATTDYLTGLPNRRSVLERAEKEFALSKRYNQPLSVIIADIDRFKSVNDVYGHATGDFVLQKVTEIFQKAIRQTDCAGRIGGEEFLFILPNTDIREAKSLADRLCLDISSKEYNVLKNKIKVTVSFGLAAVDYDDSDISETIKRADKALYIAKKSGGNSAEQVG